MAAAVVANVPAVALLITRASLRVTELVTTSANRRKTAPVLEFGNFFLTIVF